MNIISKWSLMIGLAVAFASCKKDDSLDYYQGGTAPVLTLTDSGAAITSANKALNSFSLSWTNPNYQFSSGISSQNVNYQLEMDTLGSNFTNPKMFVQTISNNLSYTFNVDEINADLSNKMGLATGMPHTIQMRVVAGLGSNNAVSLPSNVLQFVVNPYAPPPAVKPPVGGVLYIVGSATPGGWPPLSNDPSVEQFTTISSTEYKITIALNGGGEYKLVSVPGQWTEQWSVAAQDTYPNGGPFVLNGANCIAPATSGTYVIDVNFQTGFFTVTLQ
ncbi:MAG: SusE domain-containing protein [Bacteroidetes bacterium]|nr:SusE domain-containing protein [Bacteroidota bacterium]